MTCKLINLLRKILNFTILLCLPSQARTFLFYCISYNEGEGMYPLITQRLEKDQFLLLNVVSAFTLPPSFFRLLQQRRRLPGGPPARRPARAHRVRPAARGAQRDLRAAAGNALRRRGRRAVQGREKKRKTTKWNGHEIWVSSLGLTLTVPSSRKKKRPLIKDILILEPK